MTPNRPGHATKNDPEWRTILAVRVLLAIGSAGVIAALILTAASAGSPRTSAVSFAVAHDSPVAGRSFSGLIMTNLDTRVTQVRCVGKIGGKPVRGRLHRFYSSVVGSPVAVSCNWQIPAGTGGKRLDARAYAFIAHGPTFGASPVSWRIKP